MTKLPVSGGSSGAEVRMNSDSGCVGLVVGSTWRGDHASKETMMTQEQKIIRTKVGVLELAKQLGNVSRACNSMGYS